eukprot:8252115-Pyramimonas_sp.AAC.1
MQANARRQPTGIHKLSGRMLARDCVVHVSPPPPPAPLSGNPSALSPDLSVQSHSALWRVKLHM